MREFKKLLPFLYKNADIGKVVVWGGIIMNMAGFKKTIEKVVGLGEEAKMQILRIGIGLGIPNEYNII